MSNRPAIIVALFAAYLAAVGGVGPQVMGALADTPVMGLAPAAVLLLFAGILAVMARRGATAMVVAFDLGMLMIVLLVANYARLGLRWHGTGPTMEMASRLALVLAGGGPLAVAALALARPRPSRSERWWRLSPVLEMPRLLWRGDDRNLCPHRLSLVAGLLLMLVGVAFMGGQTVERSVAGWFEEDVLVAADVAGITAPSELPPNQYGTDIAPSEPVTTLLPAIPELADSEISPETVLETAPPTTAPGAPSPVDTLAEAATEEPAEAAPDLRPVSPGSANIPPRTRRPHTFQDRRPTPAETTTPVARTTPSRAIDHASRPLPADARPRPREGSTNLDLIETADSGTGTDGTVESDPINSGAPATSAPTPVSAAPPPERAPSSTDAAAPPKSSAAPVPSPIPATLETPIEAPESPPTRQYPASVAPASAARPFSIEVPRGATLPLGLGLVVGGLLLLTRGLGSSGHPTTPSTEK